MIKKVILCICLFAALGILANAVGCSQHRSEAAKREKLANKFVACLSDSIDDVRREEILQLLDLFWRRVDGGKVFPEDEAEIMTKLRKYVDAGAITSSDLLYFMAQVGYYTHRKDPRYNLPEGIPDHPTINPNALLLKPVTDSTGVEKWYAPPPSAPDDTTKK